MFVFGNHAPRRHATTAAGRAPRSPSTSSSRESTLARRFLIAASIVGVAAVSVVAGSTNPAGAQSAGSVQLQTAAEYSVLGGTTVTNVGPSSFGQSVGVWSGTAISGITALMVGGTIHAGDVPAQTAQSDLTAAYLDAAGRSFDATVATELGGTTLVGGVYRGATLGITGPLTLDGANNPNSVFIFQADSTLITAPGSSVVLINGAQPCNVFWQVGSSATIDTGTTFIGNILALTSITVNTGATVQGRALARNGAVTLDTNTFTAPACDLTPITVPSVSSGSTPGATTPGAVGPGVTTPGATPGLSTIPGETLPFGVPGSTDLVAAAGPTFPAGPGGAEGSPGLYPQLPSTGDNTVTGALAAAMVVALGVAALLIARRRPSTG